MITATNVNKKFTYSGLLKEFFLTLQKLSTQDDYAIYNSKPNYRIMKTILGLDLGSNSIGWALIQQDFENKQGKILGLGSRIIPMPQDTLGDFESGAPIKTQTAERTRLRSTRRLKERHLLRRERLHRVLNMLGFLPKHYAAKIDFDNRLGKFLPETETKFVYDSNGEFIFKKSFEEMLNDFKKHQPKLLHRKNRKGEDAKIPYDWTVYYLRKKALTNLIENEELAWLLLHFNQKRGYYQLRGEDVEEQPNKLEEFYSLRICDVNADQPQRGSDKIWYNIVLENGWIYRRESKIPLLDWKDKTRDFIVTTDLNEDGSIKKDKDGKEKRSFRSPKEDDWKLLKKKTESEIDKSKKTVGEYIYDALLQKPDQKIRGKLVRTIERRFYREELIQIIKKQIELNNNLQDAGLYKLCVEELYPHNLQHKATLLGKGFLYLVVEDILFYQRPLRSQKSTISNCPMEFRTFVKDGIKKTEPLKCISKSHPLYQEFRLWQWISNLRIISKEDDEDETTKSLQLTGGIEALFDFLQQRKEIDQKALLKYFNLKESNYRWNYVEDKKYPCNETRIMILSRFVKVADLPKDFLTREKEEQLWHIIYSVTDKIEYEKALKSFAAKNNLDEESFFEAFRKFPPFPANYGSYSAKAIKKLLPLMRFGERWQWDSIDANTKVRIGKFIRAEIDDEIKDKVRDKIGKLSFVNESDYQGLPEWLAKYVVYDRHSERSETGKWATVADLEQYLQLFRQHSMKNPIVEQVVTETLRTVKDIWQYFGDGREAFFDEIHIELGREMKNPAEEKKRITEQVTKNENTNLRIKALLAELLNDKDIENVRPYSPMQQDILKIYEDDVLNGVIEIPEDIEKISKLAQPTSSQLQRYKLWLEQKYRSPYTGAIIPLNKLFTPVYEMEHIIPQSRYYDDSFKNKVICEAAVNKLKDNQTGLEFIQNHSGQIVQLGMGKIAKVFTKDEYIDFVRQHYAKSRTKKNNLMALEIPEKMIERQLNDTRYISKYIMQTLSNIVRAEKNDDGANSKNVLASNGKITADLRQDWGMDAIWNELILPRFERLNRISNTTNFTVYNDRYQKHLPIVPLELQKGFQKKRIDHRHHAMDALIIACATRSHINFMNNKNALEKNKSLEQRERERNDLKIILCDKRYNDGSNENYKWVFKQPWETFVPDAREKLEQVIVSFKNNIRIINKTVNQYVIRKDGKKEFIKQQKGQNWALRKPLHKDTVSGIISLQKKKVVSISAALDAPQYIVDKPLRRHLKKLISDGYDKYKLIKYFKENDYKFNEQEIAKVEVYYWENDNVASRKSLDISFTKARIESITDASIQQILLKHLSKNDDNPEIAFSPEGIEEMNKNIVNLNNGKSHKPISKVRTYEAKGNKFAVGQTGNKSSKFVETAKGTNLFFAVYESGNAKRNFDTVPLNEVIVHQQLNASLSSNDRKSTASIPVEHENGKLLFSLSPNDLVYIPSQDDLDNSSINLKLFTANQVGRIYKFVSCTGSEGHFVHHTYAAGIVSNEQGTNNKSERMLDFKHLPAFLDDKGKPQMIKNVCWKIETNRLGQIVKIIK
ncbi:MAG TPA: HNH endonuclease domain-containing protein [Mucilaginibacter sp.]|nr:HNH endonuclease domain-containing protein [Mucilaginibacter sp.]